MGVAACHLYLSRAALSVKQHLHAAVLGGSAFRIYESIDESFGQMLALQDVAKALAALEDHTGAAYASLLMWHRAAAIDHPSATQIGEQLREMLEGFDPSQPPDPQLLTDAAAQLQTSLAACEQSLQDQGLDPYDPPMTGTPAP